MRSLDRPDDPYQPINDLLADAEFWELYRTTLREQLTDTFIGIWLAGARAGESIYAISQSKKVFDFEHASIFFSTLQEIAEQAIGDYVVEVTDSFALATYQTISDSVTLARQTGAGIAHVVDQISHLFSRSRAQVIAVTETTRLYGQGAMATYNVLGATGWLWQTVEDALVDDTCQANSQKRFPMSTRFEPAHPNCRCFPLPLTGFSPPISRYPDVENWNRTEGEVDAEKFITGSLRKNYDKMTPAQQAEFRSELGAGKTLNYSYLDPRTGMLTTVDILNPEKYPLSSIETMMSSIADLQQSHPPPKPLRISVAKLQEGTLGMTQRPMSMFDSSAMFISERTMLGEPAPSYRTEWTARAAYDVEEIEYIARHEWAHAIDTVDTTPYVPTENINGIRTNIRVSGYGNSDGREWIAEAFVDYTVNKYPVDPEVASAVDEWLGLTYSRSSYKPPKYVPVANPFATIPSGGAP